MYTLYVNLYVSKPKKKFGKKKIVAVQQLGKSSISPTIPPDKKRFLLYSFFLAVTCIILYFNTLNNGYAFDDKMMITENEITKKDSTAFKSTSNTASSTAICTRKVLMPVAAIGDHLL